MSEQAQPSPEELLTEVISFLNDWGKNFNDDDKRVMARIDNGTIIPYEDQIEFSAIYDAITLLKSCSLSYRIEKIEGYGETEWVIFTLLYPPSSKVDSLLNASKTYTGFENHLSQIAEAITDVLWVVTENHFPGCAPVLAEPELDSALSGTISNQVAQAEQYKTWENLRFRSESEVRIAQALDEVQGVLFFPNCKSRLGHPKGRENREPDFLVCYRGKWGILEVDGPTHRRAAPDHARDRLFKLHGVHLVEHYDATECYENPQRVVKQFLYLLSQAS